MDQAGHGTHVAGIIAGKSSEYVTASKTILARERKP